MHGFGTASGARKQVSHDGSDDEARKARAKSEPIENEIARRGIRLKRTGAERVGPCPKCGGDDRFAINTSKQVFNCRGCGAKGDVIALVQWLDDCNFGKALDTLVGERPRTNHNGNGSAKPKGRAEPKPVEVHAGDYDYYGADGLLLFQVQRFNLLNADGTPVLKDGKPDKHSSSAGRIQIGRDNGSSTAPSRPFPIGYRG